jgi:hypothetical protein
MEKALEEDIKHEIELQRWFSSERAGKDVGDKAEEKWKNENLESFIKFWHEMNDCEN